MQLEAEDFKTLQARLGDEHLSARLRAQVNHTLQMMGSGKGRLHYENMDGFSRLAGLGLRLSGLRSRGERNALALRLNENRVSFPGGLPAGGLRILHLSDLHLDAYAGFGQRIAERIGQTPFDLAVLTGDYRFYNTGDYERITADLQALIPALSCRLGVFGILGNHDFIEMAPLLEKFGVRMLINEGVLLPVGPHGVWLGGVDDPHFYGLHDLNKAASGAPSEAPRLLLAHSPEIYREAASAGWQLYLCGHTHAGQICLPGGLAPLLNANCPRRYTAGSWTFEAMQGYTSRGAGSSGVFARFFCPPEVTLHHLTSPSA